MDGMTREDLRALLETRSPLCISLYMPTYRAGADVQQNPIRLKNLLKDVQEALGERGLRAPEAKELLQPARDLVRDSAFWRYQSDGLALFIAPEKFTYYRVPLSFDSLYVIANRFHIKPLLPILGRKTEYFILALSQKKTRLLRCTADEVGEVELEGVPRTIMEALGEEVFERQVQFHTKAHSPSGLRPAVVHGQGAGADELKDRTLRYFRAVDKGLRDYFKGRQQPLILAAVEHLFPLYREVNSYANLFEEGIPGNPDEVRAHELRDRGWELLQPRLQRDLEEATEQFQEMLSAGRAANDLQAVLQAAYQGRVDTLFVAVGVRRWGRYDPKADDLQLDGEEAAGKSEDLLDLAATQTLLTGGTIFAVSPDQVPGNEPVAAMFRY